MIIVLHYLKSKPKQHYDKRVTQRRLIHLLMRGVLYLASLNTVAKSTILLLLDPLGQYNQILYIVTSLDNLLGP